MMLTTIGLMSGTSLDGVDVALIETDGRRVQSLGPTGYRPYAEAERARKADEAQLATSGVSLITYLEERGSQSGLEIPALTPKADAPIGDGRIIESTVELTLTDVQLSKLVSFLSAVERGPGMVRVKSLRIEPHTKDNVLTAWATVATYKLKEGP